MSPGGPASGGLDATQASELHKLLNALTASDPAERDRAEGRLAFMGPAVRPALLEAIRHGESPELRARAAHALLRIPCDAPGDTPGVRQLLREYNSAESDKRIEAILKFSNLERDGSVFPALLRLLGDEPNNDVRWVVAGQLGRLSDEAHLRSDDAHLQTLRSLDQTADTAPALVLAGWAWVGKDVSRGNNLLARALKLEAQNPSSNDAAIGWAFYRVYESAIIRGAYDEAAEVLRERAWRCDPDYETSPLLRGSLPAQWPPNAGNSLAEAQQTEDDEEDPSAPPALLALFVLHAQVGPLRGFEHDLEIYQDFLTQPEILYALARAEERAGKRMMADAYDRAAFAASGASGETRLRVADFLTTHGWNDQAEREYAAAIGLPGPGQLQVDAQAFAGLSHLAGNAGDDARAAQLLQTAIERLQQAGIHAEDDLMQRYPSELEWRRLRAARARHDDAAISQQLDRLTAEQELANPEVAIDVILALRELHRKEDAARIFDGSYTALKRAMDNYPPEPVVMNGMAWLCARCDEHLDEALELATAATRIAGGDGAFLDTAAECNFRVGRRAEAVRLETQALRFQPGDRFMRSQLKRYRGE